MPVESSDVEDESSQPASRGRGILGHAVCYGIGAVSVQLVSIALLPLYTRYMSTGEYGVLSILYRVGYVLNLCLMTGGIQMAALNFWGKSNSEEERKRVAATIGLVSGAGIIISALFVLIAATPLANFLSLSQPNLLAFGIIAMMLQGTTFMPLALMQARMESLSYLISTVSIAICQLVLVALALVYFRAGVWGAVIAMAITYGLFGLILNVREFTKSSLIPDFSMLKGVLKFSLPFIPGGVFYFMLQNGDQFFLQKYHGEATVGIYALAYKIAQSVSLVASQPLMQIWNAKIYEVHKQADASLQFGRVYSRILFTFILGGVLAILFKGEVMLLVGKDFGPASIFIAPLILANVFQIFGSLMDGAIYVTRRTDLKPWILGASAVVITIAYMLMIPKWAEFGAVYATLLGYAFFCVLNSYVAQRVFRVQVEYLRIAAVLSIAITLCVVELLFPMHFVVKVALVLLALAGVWAAGLFHQEEKRWLGDAVQKGLSLVSPSFRKYLGSSWLLCAAIILSLSLSRPLNADEIRPLVAYVGTFSSPLGDVLPTQVDLPPGNGRGIHLFQVNRESGAMSPSGIHEMGTSPSCLVVNAAGTRIYSSNETDRVDGKKEGSVSAFSIDSKSGNLTLLNTVSSGGDGPTYVSIHPSGKFLFAANYFGGSVCVLPIETGGRLGKATDVKNDKGKIGPTKAVHAPPGSFAFSGHDRTHAHMIQSDPSGRFVLHVDLGLDKIFVWKFDQQKGVLIANDPPSVSLPPGDGPRHFYFHPNGRWFYSIQEEGSTLVLFDYDANNGTLNSRQTISTLPKGFAGSNFCSEILVSSDGKFVYAGNRLHDSVGIFAVGANGELSHVADEWTRGNYPRSFNFDPTGKFLYCCNQRADHVAVFNVNRKTGGLTFTGHYAPVGNPSSIVFLDLAKPR